LAFQALTEELSGAQSLLVPLDKYLQEFATGAVTNGAEIGKKK